MAKLRAIVPRARSGRAGYMPAHAAPDRSTCHRRGRGTGATSGDLPIRRLQRRSYACSIMVSRIARHTIADSTRSIAITDETAQPASCALRRSRHAIGAGRCARLTRAALTEPRSSRHAAVMRGHRQAAAA
jgi:hypothetical protein